MCEGASKQTSTAPGPRTPPPLRFEIPGSAPDSHPVGLGDLQEYYCSFKFLLCFKWTSRSFLNVSIIVWPLEIMNIFIIFLL